MTLLLYEYKGKVYDTWREALDAASGDNFSIKTKYVEVLNESRVDEIRKKYEKENEVFRD